MGGRKFKASSIGGKGNEMLELRLNSAENFWNDGQAVTQKQHQQDFWHNSHNACFSNSRDHLPIQHAERRSDLGFLELSPAFF